MSDTAFFRCLKPGLLTSLQDEGRMGHQQNGIPLGGVLDKTAARMANWLLGNPPDHPVMEITLMGPDIDISGNCQIALTGANLSPVLNGVAAPMYQSILLEGENRLQFGKPITGCRSYLAVGGDWQVDSWLSSVSYLPMLEAICTASLFKKGDQISIQVRPAASHRMITPEWQPDLSSNVRIRVLQGPELVHFSSMEIATFFSTRFKVANDSNRMACRLKGWERWVEAKKALISAGVIPGTIQVTPSGEALILLADAQTVGGYHRIAQVIAADMDPLAQLRPGDTIQFEVVDSQMALEALSASLWQRFLQEHSMK
ncbi:MAG TPA: biotin-dependent carboxyltransferase family protein [Saprospiraceae bacterium]|nr:biotin-dependent carboxyltransferase family protein [Saprospiraceae bacterium]HMQ84973.1 biotin-dependent carboxyltransferase family protein [Saprospiraceae bacterium]